MEELQNHDVLPPDGPGKLKGEAKEMQEGAKAIKLDKTTLAPGSGM